MTEQSRRTFLGTIGTTIGGSLLVRESLKRGSSLGGSNQADATVPVSSLRVEASSRDVVSRETTRHPGLNSVTEWESLAGDVSAGPERVNGGFEPIRLSPNPAGKMRYSFETPFNFDQNDLSFWAYFRNRPADQLRIRLFAPDTRNQLIADQYTATSTSGSWFGIEVSPTTELGSPDLENITQLQLEVDSRSDDVLLARFETKPASKEGRVMVIFDDNRASVASAYEEMQRRGIPGAVAVIPDLVGENGHLSGDQLTAYHDDGWDMISHPQLENPLPAYSRARQRQEIIRTKRWLVGHGYPEGAAHFVAPFGKVGPETLELIEKFHLTNYMTSDGLSGTPPADPLTIDRVAIDNVQNAKQHIRRAAEYNSLLVLSAHTIGNPNDRWISHDGFVTILNQIEDAEITAITPTEYWEEMV